MNKSNYNRDKYSPFKKGKAKDIIKPKKPRIHRVFCKSDKDVIDALTIDLVQILADVGIIIGSGTVRTIAKGLNLLGWTKVTKRID